MLRVSITALLVLALTSVHASESRKEYPANAENCVSTGKQIVEREEVFMMAAGDVPASECSMVFKGEVKDNCDGLCVSVEKADFNNCNVTVTIKGESPADMKMLGCGKTLAEPWCINDNTMTVTITEPADYVKDAANPGYDLKVALYNKCGPKGSNKSISFEEAVKALDGYHPVGEFEDKEKMTFVTGICLGFGLACVFLVVLLIAYCYVKNSPKRGGKYGKPAEQA